MVMDVDHVAVVRDGGDPAETISIIVLGLCFVAYETLSSRFTSPVWFLFSFYNGAGLEISGARDDHHAAIPATSIIMSLDLRACFRADIDRLVAVDQ